MDSLIIDDLYRRADLHASFGGSSQNGISYSGRHPMVMLFSNQSVAARHGYLDGWGDDQHFHYCGEGRTGDQQLSSRGNAAVLHHVAQGKTLHLFLSVSRGVHRYLGEFKLATDQPYYLAEAPEADDGPLRSVIIFRLAPVGAIPADVPTVDHTPTTEPLVADVPVEAHNTPSTVINRPAVSQLAVRREAELVQDYRQYLENSGMTITRKKILPPSERHPQYTDLFNVSSHQLIEAKGTVTREAVRMGIGQLFDYRRFISPPPSLALLLPERPRQDLVALCSAIDVAVIWPEEGTYRSTQLPNVTVAE